jgi:phage terminase large subunit-like protein
VTRSPKHPFSKTAKDYAKRVISGKQPACIQVRQACQRFEDDFKRKDIRFDDERVAHVCEFMSNLVHVKAKWAGKPFVLEPFQVFALANIFGWLECDTGLRRYREALILLPRKNGKSLLAAGIALYMTFADGEPGAEGYSGATSMKQAEEVFLPAKAMAELTPGLADGLDIETSARAVYSLRTRSKLQPVIAKTKDGTSPHVAICDELHQALDDTQINSFRSGMGARTQPLLLVITTAGTNLAGVCRIEQLEAEAVLNKTKKNDRLFALIYTIDPEDDWRKLSSFKKANPNYGVSVFEPFFKDRLNKALQSPAEQANVRTKHLNQWVASAQGWLSAHTWAEAADEQLSLKDFEGYSATLAVDQSTRQDLTAIALTIRDGDKKRVFTITHLPAGALDASPNAGSYREWIDSGHLIETPGTASSFQEIEDRVRELCGKFKIEEAIFDPWQGEGLRQKVAGLGISTQIWPASDRALWTKTLDDFEADLKNGVIKHPNDPVLNWCAMNTGIFERGVTRIPVKANNNKHQKIDAMIATLMAYAALEDTPKAVIDLEVEWYD